MLKITPTNRKKGTKFSSKKQSKFPDFLKIKLQPSENLEYEVLNYSNALELLKRLHLNYLNNDPYIKKIFQYLWNVKAYMLLMDIKNWYEANGGCYWLCKSKTTGKYLGLICVNKTIPFATANHEWTICIYFFTKIPSIKQLKEEACITLYNYLHNYFKKQKISIFHATLKIPSTDLLKNLDLNFP
jgi:hypothetical protein